MFRSLITTAPCLGYIVYTIPAKTRKGIYPDKKQGISYSGDTSLTPFFHQAARVTMRLIPLHFNKKTAVNTSRSAPLQNTSP